MAVIIAPNVKPLPHDEPCPTCGMWWQREGSPATDPPATPVPKPSSKSWIQTAGGDRFYLIDSMGSSITLGDIAQSLSKLCRYTGHCRKFYSVAEHSYRVSLIVPPEHAFHALLHDASEAYLGDVSTPLKSLLDDYREIEEQVSRGIYARFRLPAELHPCIKAADYQMLASEVPLLFDIVDEGWKAWLTGYKPLEDMTVDSIGWTPGQAAHLFLDRALYLQKQYVASLPVLSPNRSEGTHHMLNSVRGMPLSGYQYFPSKED